MGEDSSRLSEFSLNVRPMWPSTNLLNLVELQTCPTCARYVSRLPSPTDSWRLFDSILLVQWQAGQNKKWQKRCCTHSDFSCSLFISLANIFACLLLQLFVFCLFSSGLFRKFHETFGIWFERRKEEIERSSMYSVNVSMKINSCWADSVTDITKPPSGDEVA